MPKSKKLKTLTTAEIKSPFQKPPRFMIDAVAPYLALDYFLTLTLISKSWSKLNKTLVGRDSLNIAEYVEEQIEKNNTDVKDECNAFRPNAKKVRAYENKVITILDKYAHGQTAFQVQTLIIPDWLTINKEVANILSNFHGLRRLIGPFYLTPAVMKNFFSHFPELQNFDFSDFLFPEEVKMALTILAEHPRCTKIQELDLAGRLHLPLDASVMELLKNFSELRILTINLNEKGLELDCVFIPLLEVLEVSTELTNPRIKNMARLQNLDKFIFSYDEDLEDYTFLQELYHTPIHYLHLEGWGNQDVFLEKCLNNLQLVLPQLETLILNDLSSMVLDDLGALLSPMKKIQSLRIFKLGTERTCLLPIKYANFSFLNNCADLSNLELPRIRCSKASQHLLYAFIQNLPNVPYFYWLGMRTQAQDRGEDVHPDSLAIFNELCWNHLSEKNNLERLELGVQDRDPLPLLITQAINLPPKLEELAVYIFLLGGRDEQQKTLAFFIAAIKSCATIKEVNVVLQLGLFPTSRRERQIHCHWSGSNIGQGAENLSAALPDPNNIPALAV